MMSDIVERHCQAQRDAKKEAKEIAVIDKECTEIIETHMKKLREKYKDNPKILQALKALAFGGFHPNPDGKIADWQILGAAKSLQRLLSTLGYVWDLQLDCTHIWELTPDEDQVCTDCGIPKKVHEVIGKEYS